MLLVAIGGAMCFLLLDVVQCASCCYRWCNVLLVARGDAM